MAVGADKDLKDSLKSVRVAGLHYVADESPGIRRERRRKPFQYRGPSGRIVRDPRTLRRIQSLAIPPAWSGVWICPDPHGHLQATGRDDRGRKQFRYHPRWREVRDETKYARMISFAKALPQIRRRLRKDLALPGLPQNKVLAIIVRLLEISLIRVGNDAYARANDSFGLTTMRDRHVDVRGSTLRFSFCGKSGKWHEVDIQDRRIAALVKRCQDLPGQELFQFVADDGRRRDVKSDDVNAYLRETTGQDFTAKDFRTWAGTVLAALALCELKKSRATAKNDLAEAIVVVARKLGNTPAICRKCYIHPHVIEAYLDGTLVPALRRRVAKSSSGLRPDEAAVLSLLEHRPTLAQKLAQSISRERTARSLRPRKKASHPPRAPGK